MKFPIVRLAIISVVIVLGLIAITQARHGLDRLSSKENLETTTPTALLPGSAPQPIPTDEAARAKPLSLLDHTPPQPRDNASYSDSSFASADAPYTEAETRLETSADSSPAAGAQNLYEAGVQTPNPLRQVDHGSHVSNTTKDNLARENIRSTGTPYDPTPVYQGGLAPDEASAYEPRLVPETRGEQYHEGSDGNAHRATVNNQTSAGSLRSQEPITTTSPDDSGTGGFPRPFKHNQQDFSPPVDPQPAGLPSSVPTVEQHHEYDSHVRDNNAQPATGRVPQESLDISTSPSDQQPLEMGNGQGTGRPGASHLEGAQVPVLTLEKLCPEEIRVGRECTFEVFIQNAGKIPVHNVQVYDEIPHGTQLVSTSPSAQKIQDGQIVWTLGTLDAGDETTLEIHLMPLEEGEDVGSVATVQFESYASVRTKATKPELVLKTSGPKKVMLGDQVTIDIEISNKGSGDAIGLIILENVPPQLSHPAGKKLEYDVGTLSPGETRSLHLVLTAEQAGEVSHVLTARGDDDLNVQDTTHFEVIAPDLRITLSGPDHRYLERQATYTVSVHNPGSAPAKQIELVTYLPQGMKFVRADKQGHYDQSAHRVIWGLQELPAREQGNVELVTLPIEIGKQTLRAEGRANQGLSDKVQQAVEVEGIAAIKFDLVDLEDPIGVGEKTSYEIRVVNQGSKAATNLRLMATIPPDMKPLTASGPTDHSITGSDVVFEPLGRLAPKADTTYQINVEGIYGGDQRVRVQLVTDELQKPVIKEESTHVYADH